MTFFFVPHRCLNHLDILECEHGGLVELMPGLYNSKAFSEGGKLLTEEDLILKVIYRCSAETKCNHVKSVEFGRASAVTGDSSPVLLECLVARSDTGAKVTLATSIFSMLKKTEDIKLKVYPDIYDNPTIGMGLNLSRDPDALRDQFKSMGLDYDKIVSGEHGITYDDALELAQKDIDEHMQRARRDVSNFDSLSPDRQKAIFDLAYNFGKVKDVVAAPIEAGDFDEAVRVLSTDDEFASWRTRAPQRAARVINAIQANHVVSVPAINEWSYHEGGIFIDLIGILDAFSDGLPPVPLPHH